MAATAIFDNFIPYLPGSPRHYHRNCSPEARRLAASCDIWRFPIAFGGTQSEEGMALKVRRVITGHDANGKAIVQIDEVVSKLKEGRPGAMVAPIWTTEGFPVNNDGHDDAATRPVGTTLPGGTILRVVEFSPGVQSRNHRTDSIDYAIIMSGEIDMEMDGAMIHLKAGDVLVQRGTIHNWINKGTAPCVIAFALIDGKPVSAGGKVLNAVG
jgi:quercetin dioxygenase-like cupin family protein